MADEDIKNTVPAGGDLPLPPDNSESIDAPPMPPDRSHPEGISVRQDTAGDGDELENLFAEFENQVSKPEPKQDDPLRFDQPLSQEHAILDYLSSLEQERHIMRERADFEGIAQRAQAAVANAPDLPPDYAKLRMEQWARNEYQTNPEFSNAWETRHSSQEAASAVSRTVDRAIRNLQKEVAQRRAYDADVTEDRAAVTEAIRRGAHSNVPEEPAKNYGSLNDAELRDELSKFGL